LLAKEVFDKFRDVLSESFQLQRKRDYYSNHKTTAEVKRLLLYSHAPTRRRVWLDMNEKVDKYKMHRKYKDKVDFHIIENFGALSPKNRRRCSMVQMQS